jgi:hypothetical protein
MKTSNHPLSTRLWIESYRIVFLSVVLYGCKTRSVAVRKEYILRAFYDKQLDLEKENGGQRKLRVKEFHIA